MSQSLSDDSDHELLESQSSGYIPERHCSQLTRVRERALWVGLLLLVAALAAIAVRSVSLSATNARPFRDDNEYESGALPQVLQHDAPLSAAPAIAVQCAESARRVVLVTGISGLIGSHVARALVRDRPCYTVWGLVRPRSDLTSLVGVLQHVQLIEGDISDAYRMRDVIGQLRPHYIYHFAAQAINGLSNGSPSLTLDANVQGTLHLLEAMRTHQLLDSRFFLAGSSTEYGRTADTWHGDALPESAPQEPVSPYGVSKAAAEMLCRQYWLAYKIPFVVGRFFIQIGPHGTDSLAIQQFARQIAMAELGVGPARVQHGNLATSRDISDVAVSARMVIPCLEKGVVGEAYNIASGVGTSVQHLLDIAVKLSTVHIETVDDPSRARPYDEKVLLADISKIVELTGIRPVFHATKSVQRILDYWRQKVRRLYGGPSLPALPAPEEAPSAEMSSTADLSCPFGNIDLVLITIPRDRPMLVHFMRSLRLFMPCWNTLHIITDDLATRQQLLAWIDIEDLRVQWHLMEVPASLGVLSGYIAQAWKANWYDQLTVSTGAEFVMAMDADTILTLPITCASLFDEEGRHYLPGWPIQIQDHFHFACEDHIGACQDSYMAFFPMLFDVRMFAPMREHVMRRWGAKVNQQFDSFDAAFASWATTPGVNPQWYSQFVNMGEYMRQYQPNMTRVLHYPPVVELDRAKLEARHIWPGLHYGWRYCHYLGACTEPDDYRHDRYTPAFAEPWNPHTVEMIERVLNHGWCLQEHLRAQSHASPNTTAVATSADFDLLCAGEQFTDLPASIKTYQTVPADMDYIRATYTPQPMGSACLPRVK